MESDCKLRFKRIFTTVYGVGAGVLWAEFILIHKTWPELSNSLLPDGTGTAERISGFAAITWFVMGTTCILGSSALRRDWRIWLIALANVFGAYFPLADVFKYSN
jgi:hypothetical protein